MSENPSYIYNVEFAIDRVDIYDIPDIENAEELDTLIQFQMKPNVLLEITEAELIDAVNCGEKRIKHAMFSLSEDHLNMNKEGCIVAKKVKCANNHVVIGTYNISQLDQCFLKLKSRYDKQQKKNESQAVRITTPITSAIKELAPLKNEAQRRCGSLMYVLRLTCFGPSVTKESSSINEYNGFGFLSDINSIRSKTKEEKCLNNCEAFEEEFDEYIAQVNGNSLKIRVSKSNPYLVTRIFDSSNSNEKLTISGCDQKIDFQFPRNFICCECKKSFGKCKCIGDSYLTSYQKNTSCVGKSFKNSTTLPIIRGTLKYPGRFEDQSICFNVQNKCHSNDATNNYGTHGEQTRNACLQVDSDNMEREILGNCKIPKGIEICKLSCDNDSDVFVLKLGKRGKTKCAKEHDIELVMRTPRALNFGQKRMETREIQVIEEEFEDVMIKKKLEAEKKQEKELVSVSKTVKKGAKDIASKGRKKVVVKRT